MALKVGLPNKPERQHVASFRSTGNAHEKGRREEGYTTSSFQVDGNIHRGLLRGQQQEQTPDLRTAGAGRRRSWDTREGSSMRNRTDRTFTCSFSGPSSGSGKRSAGSPSLGVNNGASGRSRKDAPSRSDDWGSSIESKILPPKATDTRPELERESRGPKRIDG